MKEADFLRGWSPDRSLARLITLKNSNGLIARFTNYGARWVSMWTPDKEGHFDDILLGFDTLSGYAQAGERYHGAIVGRVCGRIGNARFRVNNKDYHLASNDAYGSPVKNHLHGGITAFHNRMWEVKEEAEEHVIFSLFSPDGDEGYPGNLRVEAAFTLTPNNRLRMECKAFADRTTPVNITHHAFFNLQADKTPVSMLSQTLTLQSSNLIACDKELIPTGEIFPVTGTFLDFTSPKTIAESILSADDDTVKRDNGFSVAFMLEKENQDFALAAKIEDKANGRSMELYTNQPSLQVYNGYFMDGSDRGKSNTPYHAGSGIALEPQGFPDAPNHPSFPSILVDKDNPYHHITEYRFYPR